MSTGQELTEALVVKSRKDQADHVAAHRNRRWVLLAVSLATFMTYLDNNIINVAIPTIQRDLRLTQSGIEWVVSGYILLFAGLLLAGGRLADVFGRKRLFSIGLAIFTASSLFAGLSSQIGILVLFRSLQGLGAAMLMPATLAILTTTYPEPKEQARAIGAWSAVGALALAVGPLLGGLLTEDVNWHWIFYINVPVGVVTLALSTWVIPAIDRPQSRRLDSPGVLASAAALTSLTSALIEGPQVGWTALLILALFAFAAASGALFVVIERRAADPMIDLSLFANRMFASGTIALMMWAFGLFGIYFFTSLYLQDVLGFSALKAGVAFVPMAILMATGAAVSDRVAARVGAYRSVGFAMGLMGLGIVSITFVGSHATFAGLMPFFAVVGIGGGLTIPLTSTVLGVMPSDREGVASAVFNASREMAGLLGITIIGVILSARQRAELRAGHSATQSFLSGYRMGLLVAGVLVISGGLAAWTSLKRASQSPGRDLDRDEVGASSPESGHDVSARAAETAPGAEALLAG